MMPVMQHSRRASTGSFPVMQTRVDGGVFAPANLSALIAHFDPSDTTSIADTTNLINQINDLSGNANHATGVTTTRPLTNTATINNHNIMRFDGVNDTMITAVVDLATLDEFTAFGIVRKNGLHVSGSARPFGTANNYFQDFTTGATYEAVVPTVLAIPSGAGLSTGEVALFTFQSSKSRNDSRTWKNGTLITTNATAVTALVSQTLNIGSRGAARWFNGDIGEMIFYNGIISEADIAHNHTGLLNKWGI